MTKLKLEKVLDYNIFVSKLRVFGANGVNGVHVLRISVEYKQGQENA